MSNFRKMNSIYCTFYILFLIIMKIFASNPENNLKSIWIEEEWGPLPEDPSNVISILYRKLSDMPTGISSAAFKKFVDCSTGFTDCPGINTNPNQATVFLTDCAVNMALSPPVCNVLNSCTKGRDLLSLLPSFNETTDVVLEEQFKSLLPYVMYQMQSRMCKDLNEDFPIHTAPSKKPSSLEVWGYGILFVTLISGSSLAGVSVLPMMARDFYQKLLTALIGLAVGSLAASAVFHLIPQAFGLIKVGDHSYLFFSLCILGGIWMFFMIERILKIVFTFQKVRCGKIPNSVSVQTMVPKPNHVNKEDNNHHFECGSCGGMGFDGSKSSSHDSSVIVGCEDEASSGTKFASSCLSNSRNVQLIFASQEQAIKASFGHEQKPEKSYQMQEIEFQQGKDSVIATVAWMIIFGDGFHNFIDGVSIGAAFQESILTGISISLAVLCEELPHELGDFAVLINSGMTMKQALFYNFLSATTCYLGMVIGIVIGEFTQDSTYIFALAAGMFLYISLVDMLPEMNETATKAAEHSLRDVFQVLFLQNLGMFIGVFILFVLAYYQDKISLG